MERIMIKLQEPFYPEEIEWRVGATTQTKDKGLALAYVTNRAIQNRLDEVFGCFGWQNEFKEWHGDSQLCGISVLYEGQWITKWDGADDSATEPTKGGLSDAMKRAAYQWGIGRYLYKLPQVWVQIKPAGKSYVIVEKPKLPSWALPAGYKPENKPARQVTEIKKSEPPKRDPVLTTAQRNEFGDLVKNDIDPVKAKDRLKELVTSLGHQNLSEVKQSEYEKLKNAFIEYGLPFSFGEDL